MKSVIVKSVFVFILCINLSFESFSQSGDTSKHVLITNYGWITGGNLDTSGTFSTANFATNAKVHICAFNPLAGTIFFKWTGDISYIKNADTICTTVTIPEDIDTITLTATYKTGYILTVINGSGSGTYEPGEKITIVSDFGTNFKDWIGNVQEDVADTLADTTTVTMPATDITIEAEEGAPYSLTVNNGSGSGWYSAGTIVPVVSNYGADFMVWRGDIQDVANTLSNSTTVTMPAADITIDAIKAQNNLYIVNINVSDVTSFENISDAIVTIFVSGVDTLVAIDSTDGNGNMEFLLPAGTYIANATANGYENEPNAIPDFNVTPGVSDFYIYMQPCDISLKENGLNILSVYPNPTKDKLNIGLPEGQVQEVIVTDILGKPEEVRNVTENNLLILDVSDLTKGLYNITIIIKDKSYRALFVVE